MWLHFLGWRPSPQQPSVAVFHSPMGADAPSTSAVILNRRVTDRPVVTPARPVVDFFINAYHGRCELRSLKDIHEECKLLIY